MGQAGEWGPVHGSPLGAQLQGVHLGREPREVSLVLYNKFSPPRSPGSLCCRVGRSTSPLPRSASGQLGANARARGGGPWAGDTTVAAEISGGPQLPCSLEITPGTAQGSLLIGLRGPRGVPAIGQARHLCCLPIPGLTGQGFLRGSRCRCRPSAGSGSAGSGRAGPLRQKLGATVQEFGLHPNPQSVPTPGRRDGAENHLSPLKSGQLVWGNVAVA